MGIDPAYAREMVRCLPVETARVALADAGLSEAILNDPEARLEPDRYTALHHAVIRASDDEMFGLLPRPLPRGTFAALVEVLVRVGTVADALHATTSMYRIFTRRPAWGLEVDAGVATVSLPATEVTPLYVHMMLHLPRRVLEWLAGVPIQVVDAELDRRLAGFALQSEVLLGCPPRLGDRCSWSLDAELLQLRVVRRPEEVGPWVQRSLGELVRPPEAPTVPDRVRRVLAAVQPVASLDLAATAARLGLSRATLARRLQADGTTFQAVKDALRRDVAMATLARPDGTVEVAARTVGFCSARAFRRAFLAWTGETPGAWSRGRG